MPPLQKSLSSTSSGSSLVQLRFGLIAVAFLCIGAQLYSLNVMKTPNTGSEDEQRDTARRGLNFVPSMQDVDREFMADAAPGQPPEKPRWQQEQEAKKAQEEVHAAETAELKAAADKAKAEAEIARLEALKLKSQVEQAKLEAEKEKQELAEKAQHDIEDAKKQAEKAAAYRANQEIKKAKKEAEAAVEEKVKQQIAAEHARKEAAEAEAAEKAKLVQEAMEAEEKLRMQEDEVTRLEEEAKKLEDEEAEKAKKREERLKQKQAEKKALDDKIAAKKAARESAAKENTDKEAVQEGEKGTVEEEEPPKEDKEEAAESVKEDEPTKEEPPKEGNEEPDTKDAAVVLEAKEVKKWVVPTAPSFNDDTTIRQWGCGRNETPFIFVHIGKAGGGGVRSRMAAATLAYNRSAWYRLHEDSNYYYPVYDDKGVMHKGKFATSTINNYIPQNATEFEQDFKFEGIAPCAATTPLGQALSCPITTEACNDFDEDGVSNNRCDLVYMGHNLLGNELHWLPNDYLVDWWSKTEWGRKTDDFIKYLLPERHSQGGGQYGGIKAHKKARRMMDYKMPEIECPPGPLKYRDYKKNYAQCSSPKENWMDEVTKFETGSDPISYGAKVIASLPVTRVTVLREPFSWLTSKFFWHDYHFSRDKREVTPDRKDAKNDTIRKQRKNKQLPEPNFVACDDIDEAAYGWASMRAMTYIFYLCGEHCMGSWVKGVMTMEDLERQAAYNLRNSFAVVGLLHESDEFYKMVTQRVYYMDTSLNPEVQGKSHSSGKHEEAKRCKDVYSDPAFQTEMLAKSPALAALNRLYAIAVEVNAFQQKELKECSAK